MNWREMMLLQSCGTESSGELLWSFTTESMVGTSMSLHCYDNDRWKQCFKRFMTRLPCDPIIVCGISTRLLMSDSLLCWLGYIGKFYWDRCIVFKPYHNVLRFCPENHGWEKLCKLFMPRFRVYPRFTASNSYLVWYKVSVSNLDVSLLWFQPIWESECRC